MKKRETKRITSEPGCCMRQEIFLSLNFPLSFNDLPYFISFGYKTKKSYTDRGVWYIEGNGLIAIGAIGQPRLQIKCKKASCFAELDKLEDLIMEMTDDFKAKVPNKEDSQENIHLQADEK